MRAKTITIGFMNVGLLLAGGAGVIALTGCDRNRVDERQGAAAFGQDVETRLSGFESRLSHVKSKMAGREQSVKSRVEALTEQAEEKIETLRKSTLPALDEATGEEESDRIKGTINDALADIDDAIEEAEAVIADVTTPREEFSEETNTTLAELRDRYDDLKQRAENYGGAAKAEIDLALESAEEAIQEARSNLDEYEKAAQDQADDIRDSVSSLLADASRELDEAAEAMKD